MSEPATAAPPVGRGRQPLLLLLLAVVGLVAWSIGTEYYTLVATAKHSIARVSSYVRPLSIDTTRNHDDIYPEEIFTKNWVDAVPVKDMTHLSSLHIACTQYKDSVIPWDLTLDGKGPEILINETDPDVYNKLRQCPDVDIYIGRGLRGFGYCEDAVAYAKFMRGRLIPKWVVEKNFFDPQMGKTGISYHELCPDTPMLFLNHYWDGLPDDPKWPAGKPMYLMPNIEMYELGASHYRRADVVICKTVVCDKYLRKWLVQEGNPTNTQVIFARHTSSNLANYARVQLGDDAIAPKNFKDPKFLHVVGGSIQKATGNVLDCWLSRPDLPPLDIYIADDLYEGAYKKRYDARIKTSLNVKVHPGRVDSVSLGKIVAEAAFFMCPSFQEGYGHYINQARAAGGLVVTPDVAPMNELITPKSGVLFQAGAVASHEQFLGGKSQHANGLRNVTGFVATFGGKEICKAVDTVIFNMTPEQRQERAERAKQQYYFDTLYFAEKMQELRVLNKGKSTFLRRETVVPPFETGT
ncbi:hypothetical protein Poli38472_013203 [Pythium oligandrum]|uniref:Glycosyl transferase family 1 domain-containing protein n=1 Tax=Pythium oligandrum TaxID=41045 RepID=A0A8K1C2L8_PYTOL|nr:hypothetical protein Poli38472_013203 [Pythium oligandrum]|eukprot:TMW55312.1 hypothetical protein Poli38472_013203 [Pythium oligandrum]